MRARSPCREPGDPGHPPVLMVGRVVREGSGRNPVMHDREKSDDPVVPAKLPNNAQGGAAEAVEGSGSAKGNTASETRSGPSAGPARAVTWIVCAEWQRRTRKRGSRRSCITSTSTGCERRIRDSPEGRAGCRRCDVDGVRAGSRGESSGSPCSGPSRELPGEAVPESVHPEGGRAAAAARGRCAGGQDPSAGAGRGAERDLWQAPDNRHEEGNERFLHRSASDTRWPRAMRWRSARAQRSVGQGCTQAGY